MNILITGIGGFIGSEIANIFAKSNSVFGVSRSNHLTYTNVFQIDLGCIESVENFVNMDKSNLTVDCLIHLASETADVGNLYDITTIENNNRITKGALDLALHFKVKHFVNFSSTSVYPNIDGMYNEDSMVDPSVNTDCLYGLSKFNSEVLINYFLKKTSTKITHLRCGMVFSDKMENDRIYPKIKQEILQSGNATLFGMGERKVNYIFLDELCIILEKVVQKKVTGVFNIVSYCESLIEFAKQISKREKLNKPNLILVEKGNRFKFEVDNSKMKNILNYD